MVNMVTAETVLAVGQAPGTNPSIKSDPHTQQLQAISNLTTVMQLIALVLIEIRDGRKGPDAK
jgi:hypothetical protein